MLIGKLYRFISKIILMAVISVFVIPVLSANQQAINWLQALQNPDGSFTQINDIARSFQATTEVLTSFNKLNAAVSPETYTYIAAEPYTGTEYLARKILSGVMAENDVTGLINQLVSFQNEDGGFGELMAYDSSVLDTSYALVALSKAGFSNDLIINPAITYIREKQQIDGGFPLSISNQSTVYVTSMASIALQKYRFIYAVSNEILLASDYIFKQQTIAGDWPTNWDTAVSLLAIIPVVTDVSRYADAIKLLQENQLANGSWDNDVYVTAIAMRANAASSNIVLPKNPEFGLLNGQVKSVLNGLPLSGVTISLDPALSISTSSLNDGQFDLNNLSPGIYNLTYSLAGYLVSTQTVNVLAGQTVNVGIIRLQPEPTKGIISGVVSDALTGLPINGASVSFTGATAQSVVTDEFGGFSLASLPGSVSITVTALGYDALTGAGTVNAGSVLTVSPGLYATSTTPINTVIEVKGRLYDINSGLPLDAVQVVINGALSTFSDVLGEFMLSNVAEGTLTIVVSKNGYKTIQYSAQTIAGSVVDLGSVMLTPDVVVTSSTIIGTVTDTTYLSPIAGAEIRVSGITGAVISNADGVFQVDNIAATDFIVFASAVGYTSSSTSIKITEKGTVSVALNLQRAAVNNFDILDVHTHFPSFDAHSEVEVDVLLSNTDVLNKNIRLFAKVINSSNEIVEQFPAVRIPLGGNAQDGIVVVEPSLPIEVEVEWLTGTVPAGLYNIVVQAFDDISGLLLAERSTSFNILPTQRIGGNAEFNPPVVQLSAKTPVKISAMVGNRGNLPIPETTVTANVRLQNIGYQPDAKAFNIDLFVDDNKLIQPKGMDTDLNGDILVVDKTANNLSRITADGSVTEIATGFISPVDVDVDTQGNIFVVNDRDLVTRINVDGTRNEIVTNLRYQVAIEAMDDGRVLLATRNSLYEIMLDGSLNLIVSEGLSGPRGMAVDSNNVIYIANSRENKISKYENGVLSLFIENINTPYGLAIDALNNIYVTSFADGSLLKVTPQGTLTIVATGLSGPYDVKISSEGNFVVSNNTSSEIVSITPNGNKTILASTSFSSPIAGLYTPQGDFVVANGTGSTIVSISLQNEVTTLATISSVKDLALAADGGLDVLVYSGIQHIAPDGIISEFSKGVISANSFVAAPDNNGYLITSSNTSNILRADVSGVISNYTENQLVLPRAMRTSKTGEVFILDYYGVLRINIDGSYTRLYDGLTNPVGIAVDSVGNVYASNRTGNEIVKITSAGVSSIYAITTFRPGALAINQNNELFVAKVSSAEVYLVDGSAETLVVTFNNNISGDLLSDSQNNLWATHDVNNSVSKYSVDTSIQNFTVGSSPKGLMINQQGGVFVSARGIVFSIDNANNVANVISDPALTSRILYGIAVDNKSDFLTLDSNGYLYRFSSSKVLTNVYLSLDRPQALAALPNGELLVANKEFTLLKISSGNYLPEVVAKGSFKNIEIVSNQEALLSTNSAVFKLNLNDWSLSSIPGSTQNISDIALDNSGGYLVMSSSLNEINYYTAAGILDAKAIGLINPRGILFTDNGDLLIANGNNSNAGIARLRADGKLVNYSNTVGNVKYMMSEGNGLIWASSDRGIKKINELGIVVETIRGNQFYGLIKNSQAEIISASSQYGELRQYQTDGTYILLASGIASASDLESNLTGDVLIANSATDSILRVSETGELITEYLNLRGVSSFTFSNDGRLFVAYGTDQLATIMPSGERTNQDLSSMLSTLDFIVEANNTLYTSMLSVNDNRIFKLLTVVPPAPVQTGDIVYSSTAVLPAMNLNDSAQPIYFDDWVPPLSGDFMLEIIVNDNKTDGLVMNQLHVGGNAFGKISIAEENVLPGNQLLIANLNIIGADSTSISEIRASATTQVAVTGFSTQSLTADSKGNIYSTNSDKIYKHLPDGTAEIFAIIPYGAYSNTMVVDSNDNVYVGTLNSILKITPQGEISTFAPLESYPVSIAINNNDKLFVLVGSKLYGVNADATLDKIMTVNGVTDGMVMDFFGYFYILKRDYTVLKVSPDGQNVQPHITASTFEREGFPLTVDCSNNLIFAPGRLLPFKESGEEDILIQNIGETGLMRKVLDGSMVDLALTDMDHLYYDRFGRRIIIWNDTPNGARNDQIYSLPVTCGSIDTEVHIVTRSDVNLTSSIPAPISNVDLGNGTREYTWDLKGVDVQGFDIQLNMQLLGLQEGESRPILQQAFLQFNNSFDPVNPVKVDIGLPSVNVSSSISVTSTLDKRQYAPESDVTVSVGISNASNSNFTGSLLVDIIDASGANVATLPTLNIAPVAPGTTQLSTLIWNTGLTFTGNYSAKVTVLNESLEVIDTGSVGFVIATSELENIVLSSTLYTDKSNYLSWDDVAIDARVINISQNAMSLAGTAQLKVTSPSAVVLYDETFSIRNLSPAAYQNISQQLNLSDAQSGDYTVSLLIKDNMSAEVLTESTRNFSVGVTQAENNITAEVTVNVKQISTGEAITCQANFTNHSSTDIASIGLKNVLYNVKTGSVVSTETVTAAIAANNSFSQAFMPETTLLEDGSYLCMVGATNAQSLLATAGFVVINNAPAINVQTTLSSTGKGRMLILLDNPTPSYDLDPYGPDGAPLLSQQKLYLENVLSQAGWSYTIATTQNEFVSQFYAGGYTDYALFNEYNYLTRQVQNTLREAVYSGAGLLVAGGANQISNSLGEPLGVKFVGKVRHDNVLDFISSPLNLLGEVNLGIYENMKRVRLMGASIAASYQDTQPPKPYCPVYKNGDKAAVLTYEYGNGRSVYVAFDLLAQATSFTNASTFELLLKNALDYIDPIIKPKKPGTMVPINIVTQNLGASVNTRVLLTVPADMQIADAGAGIVKQNVIEIAQNLIQGQSLTETVWVRLSDANALSSVLVQTQVQLAGNWVDVDTQSVSFAQEALSTIDDALLVLNKIKGTDRNLRRACMHLEIAKRKIRLNRNTLTLRHLILSTNQLQKSSHVDSHAIRLMVDDAIKTAAKVLSTPKP